MANVGCGDDSSGSGGSGASGSTTNTSSSSAGSSGSSMTSSSSTGGSGSSTGSAGGEGGASPYATCEECIAGTGAGANECKTEQDACLADTECSDLYTWAYNNTTLDKNGWCKVFDYIKTNSIPEDVVDLYKAIDSCISCVTCKALCEPGSAAYCDALNDPNACP